MSDPGTTAIGRVAETLAGIGCGADLIAAGPDRPGLSWRVETLASGRAPFTFHETPDRADALRVLSVVRAAGAVARITTKETTC